jgi:hypothetical protein
MAHGMTTEAADPAGVGDAALRRLLKHTFFEGFRGDVDRGANGSAMRPEISVVSTVALYFESPAHARTPASAKPVRRPL